MFTFRRTSILELLDLVGFCVDQMKCAQIRHHMILRHLYRKQTILHLTYPATISMLSFSHAIRYTTQLLSIPQHHWYYSYLLGANKNKLSLELRLTFPCRHYLFHIPQIPSVFQSISAPLLNEASTPTLSKKVRQIWSLLEKVLRSCNISLLKWHHPPMAIDNQMFG